jgi:adenine-specific DNA-methyltransferase
MVGSDGKIAIGNELPSHFAERIGAAYAKQVDLEHKKTNGQFFTPFEIAQLMADLIDSKHEHVKILDPGCGTAILSCSLIESIAKKNNNLKVIELTLFEIDEQLFPLIQDVMNFLKAWLKKINISFTYSLKQADFVLSNAKHLDYNHNLFFAIPETYDIVISNPPYFKLPIDDKRAIAAKTIINGHPNIYSIFMAIAAQLLKEGGQLIFITPRSYASGGYFKTFREYFFKRIALEKIHLFVSRKDTFGKDKVLQETVIIKGVKRAFVNPDRQVTIYSSQGLRDIKTPETKIFKQHELIDLNSNEKILYIPTNDREEQILGVFKNWSGTLNKYNIQISTGPVVSFRAWDFIHENEQRNLKLTSLFWLHNVKQMVLEWPLSIEGKGQYITVQDESKSLLIPNRNYVLLRRFSAKDDKTRLIAAPYFCNFIESEYIGVENKVNYIYRPKGHLDRNEVVGICALLNSRLFDSYFRIFNGNVNVSATELREIPLPPLEDIKEIGNQIILSNDFSVENCNEIVNSQLHYTNVLHEQN